MALGPLSIACDIFIHAHSVGCNIHLEHPSNASSWAQKCLQVVLGKHATLHQCRFGARHFAAVFQSGNPRGFLQPVQKCTRCWLRNLRVVTTIVSLWEMDLQPERQRSIPSRCVRNWQKSCAERTRHAGAAQARRGIRTTSSAQRQWLFREVRWRCHHRHPFLRAGQRYRASSSRTPRSQLNEYT